MPCESIGNGIITTPCDILTDSGLVLIDRLTTLKRRIVIRSGVLNVEPVTDPVANTGTCVAINSDFPKTPLDVEITDSAKGYVLKDLNTNNTYYRLRIINNVLSLEGV